jgi:hypothetical protein
MSYNLNFGYGLRRLVDSNQRFMRAGNPVYLRLRNFPDVQNTDWAQLGFAITPSGALVGTQNVLIDPPPSEQTVSLRDIGRSMGKLRYGAHKFIISDTFVQAQCARMGVTDVSALFKQPFVVGLVTENILYSIEDIVSEQVAGSTITWSISGNGNEIR